MPQRKAAHDKALEDLNETLRRLERITTLMEQRVKSQEKIRKVPNDGKR